MSAPRSRRPADDEAVPQPPQTTPASVGFGHPSTTGEYLPFVWQQLGGIQETLGKLQHATEVQTAAIQKLEDKADDTKEKLHAINVKLAVAGGVFSVVVLIGGFFLKEVWDVLKPTVVQRLTGDSATPAANAVQPAPATPQPKR